MGRKLTFPCVEEEERKRMEVEAREKVAGGGRNWPEKSRVEEREKQRGGGDGAWAPRAEGEGDDATWRLPIG